ncbi:zinc finger protein 595 [Chelonus insularis]|uniref:zinc finger protein 595 n=1 Tax=Chelonus insularis TaxID=460826 RepID=UPI0015889470|nr:zinc finger protein 595 [Chelonus insularis]XP_034948259.1 zinc finger protein 595 [Chelonus insularis]XP_034948260.1 zinc finger protein 595 [Chelonus insularis]
MMGEIIKVSGERPNFLEDALSQTFADVFLCCSGGQRFRAHRLVLSAASSYLHEVLVAHGKIAGQCEPITVILAEVEGNDLAAILGFLYTGSTAVPSARLEAFSSTADALRIRIPPLPRVLKNQRISENIKDHSKVYDYLSSTQELEVRETMVQKEDENGLNLKMDKTICLRRLLMSDNINKNKMLPREIVKFKSHVANRVFASPWCQLVRPYHSPKSRVILQNSESCCKNIYDVSTDSFSSSRQDTFQDIYPNALNMTTVGVERLSKSLIHDVQQVTDDYPQNSSSNILRSYPPDIVQSDRDMSKCQHNHTKTNTDIFDDIHLYHKANKSSEESLDHLNQRSFEDDTINVNTVRCNDNNNNEDENNYNNNSVKSDIEVVSTTTLRDLDHKNSLETFCSSSLKSTESNHSQEKPFKCSDCGKEFSQLRNYKYHRSMHEGTGEFATTCPECGKYFNDRGYLGSHMKIHRNRKEYVCNECGKSFNQRVAYNMHMRIHTGLKPHRCEQCGKAFSRKMLLKQHLRTHSGERPYQCHICNKAFADRSNMTLHTRLHSGLKPYQCDICSKSFTKKHHLKTHLNYHTGTKPYSCPNCSLTFSQSSNMRTHYKKCINIQNNDHLKCEKNSRVNIEEKKKSEKSVIKCSVALTPPHSDLEVQTNIRDVS